MIEITARRMAEDGKGNEGIASLRWTDLSDGKEGEGTVASLVDWIDKQGGRAFVRVGDAKAVVAVIRSNPSYLRTHFDNTWSDHLLELPEF